MPLVRLSLYDWGVRVSPSQPLARPFVPTLDVRYEELDDAQAVSRRPRPTGVLLRAPRADLWLVFFRPSAQARLIDALEAHGVVVSRELRHIGWFDWMDG